MRIWWRVVVGGGASKERSVSKFAVETHIFKGLKEFYNGREISEGLFSGHCRLTATFI